MDSNQPQATPIVELKKVGKFFPGSGRRARVEALKGIDLTIDGEEDKFVVLLGPSGCGKSTLLSLIAGLQVADEGEVRVKGVPITGPSAHSVTVQQAYTCFPWLTALQNVEFPLKMTSRTTGKSPEECRHLAMDYLGKVGLGNRFDAYPRELSGGMQQRVAIARALVLRRPLLLMDEPFGALDAQIRVDMQQLLVQLWEEEKNTVIFVTHDINEALLLADRVVVLSANPARIVKSIPVAFDRPRKPELVQEPEFCALALELLKLLRTAPAATPPPPQNGLTVTAANGTCYINPSAKSAAPLLAPPPPANEVMLPELSQPGDPSKATSASLLPATPVAPTAAPAPAPPVAPGAAPPPAAQPAQAAPDEALPLPVPTDPPPAKPKEPPKNRWGLKHRAQPPSQAAVSPSPGQAATAPARTPAQMPAQFPPAGAVDGQAAQGDLTPPPLAKSRKGGTASLKPDGVFKKLGIGLKRILFREDTSKPTVPADASAAAPPVAGPPDSVTPPAPAKTPGPPPSSPGLPTPGLPSTPSKVAAGPTPQQSAHLGAAPSAVAVPPSHTPSSPAAKQISQAPLPPSQGPQLNPLPRR